MTDAVFREGDKILRGMIVREVSDAEFAEGIAIGLFVIKDGKRIPVSELYKDGKNWDDDDEEEWSL